MNTIRVTLTDAQLKSLHVLATHNPQYSQDWIEVHDNDPMMSVYRELSAIELVNIHIDRRDPDNDIYYFYRVWISNAGLWIYEAADAIPT